MRNIPGWHTQAADTDRVRTASSIRSSDPTRTTTTTGSQTSNTTQGGDPRAFMTNLNQALQTGLSNMAPAGVMRYWQNSFLPDANEQGNIDQQVDWAYKDYNNLTNQYQNRFGAGAMPGGPAGQSPNSPAWSAEANAAHAKELASTRLGLMAQREQNLQQLFPWLTGSATQAAQLTPTYSRSQGSSTQQTVGPRPQSSSSHGGASGGPIVRYHPAQPVTGHAWGPNGSGGPVGLGWSDQGGNGGPTNFAPSIDGTNGSTFGQSNLLSKNPQQSSLTSTLNQVRNQGAQR